MEGEARQSGISVKNKTISGQHVESHQEEALLSYICEEKGEAAFRDPAGASCLGKDHPEKQPTLHEERQYFMILLWQLSCQLNHGGLLHPTWHNSEQRQL